MSHRYYISSLLHPDTNLGIRRKKRPWPPFWPRGLWGPQVDERGLGVYLGKNR